MGSKGKSDVFGKDAPLCSPTIRRLASPRAQIAWPICRKHSWGNNRSSDRHPICCYVTRTDLGDIRPASIASATASLAPVVHHWGNNRSDDRHRICCYVTRADLDDSLSCLYRIGYGFTCSSCPSVQLLRNYRRLIARVNGKLWQ
ncbi:hypothetical protein J6590_070805 [Homalodisca vitripennis]|nr:hypothetical protein J6590_070805 [Homalodisca vitripennis]